MMRESTQAWHLKKIPKILHLYWGRNRKLSYMRYMTAFSFSKLNPDWMIRVYQPKCSCIKETWTTPEHKSSNYQGKDYFNDLIKLRNIIIETIDFKQLLGISENTSEVFKSDVLRWYLLATVGGIWSDFDILYIRPMIDFSLNDNQYADSDVIICSFTTKKGITFNSIGFLMSGEKKGHLFYSGLFVSSKKLCESNKDYQNLGRYLIDDYYKHEFDKETGVIVNNMPFHTIYPLSSTNVEQYYNRKKLNLINDTIGMHWYAGSAKSSKYENIIDIHNIKHFGFSPLLKEMAKQWKE